MQDGDDNENVIWKYNFISFVLLHDYFNSFNASTRTANYPGTNVAKIKTHVQSNDFRSFNSEPIVF